MRVKLTEDLTNYGDGLIPGIEGETLIEKGLWSRNSSRYVMVLFDNGIKIDVLWKGLEILDKSEIEKREKANQSFDELYRNATDIIIYTTNAGKPTDISFKLFGNDQGPIKNKKTREMFIEIFKKFNLPMTKVNRNNIK